MVQAQSLGAVFTSRNGKLQAGMTRESMQTKIAQMGLSESDKAAKKLVEAFEIADGSVDGVKDGVISADEIRAYDKEMKKKNWKTGLLIAGGVVLTGIAAYLAVKGIKSHKLNQMAAQNTPQNLINAEAAEEAIKTAENKAESMVKTAAEVGTRKPYVAPSVNRASVAPSKELCARLSSEDIGRLMEDSVKKSSLYGVYKEVSRPMYPEVKTLLERLDEFPGKVVKFSEHPGDGAYVLLDGAVIAHERTGTLYDLLKPAVMNGGAGRCLSMPQSIFELECWKNRNATLEDVMKYALK